MRLLVAACMLLTACPPPPKPVPTDADAAPAPTQDASTDAPVDAAPAKPCVSACARLSELGCPEALPVDGGSTCLQICEQAEATGKFNLKPQCISAAKTVEEVRACGSVRCKK